jgi:hypothetical protein
MTSAVLWSPEVKLHLYPDRSQNMSNMWFAFRASKSLRHRMVWWMGINWMSQYLKFFWVGRGTDSSFVLNIRFDIRAVFSLGDSGRLLWKLRCFVSLWFWESCSPCQPSFLPKTFFLERAPMKHLLQPLNSRNRNDCSPRSCSESYTYVLQHIFLLVWFAPHPAGHTGLIRSGPVQMLAWQPPTLVLTWNLASWLGMYAWREIAQ